MKSTFWLGTVILAATTASAGAQEMSCVSSGNIYKVGDVACIPACHGAQRLARCDAPSDATGGGSWTTVSNSCPSASVFRSFRMASLHLPEGREPMSLRPAGAFSAAW